MPEENPNIQQNLAWQIQWTPSFPVMTILSELIGEILWRPRNPLPKLMIALASTKTETEAILQTWIVQTTPTSTTVAPDTPASPASVSTTPTPKAANDDSYTLAA